MRTLMALLLFLTLVVPAGGQQLEADARAKTIAPYLDEQTLAVAHVDLSRLDPEALATKFAELSQDKRPEVAKNMAGFRQGLAAFKQAGGKDVFFVFSLADLPNLPFVVVPLYEGSDAQALLRFREQLKLFPGGTAEKIGQAIVAGGKDVVARLRGLKAAPPAALAKAFTAAGDTTAQLLLLPSARSRQVVEQLLPALPRELGGGPTTTLTRGILWAAAGADLAPKLSLRVVAQSQDADAAQKLHGLIVQVLKTLREDKALEKEVPDLARITALLTPRLAGDQLLVTLDDPAIATVLVSSVQKVRTAAARAQSANNLRQLAQAMADYHDKHRTFPPHASYDKTGRPLLSWRVHVLPFLNEDDLYKEFHLDEPWDSEHNRKLIARMPAVFHSPLSRLGGEHKTAYLVPAGKETIFPPGAKGVRIADITDGTSNTILIVEAADSHAVPWTKPEDLKVDEKEPLAGLTDGQRTSFQTAFADGSVHVLATAINPRTLWALFTRNGGEVVDLP